MIVRTTEEITGTDRQRDTENWTSKRIILADDGVGFSFHETTIHPGTETPLHYPDYIEAVWIVEGHGQLIDRDHGATHRLEPGTMYLLDKHIDTPSWPTRAFGPFASSCRRYHQGARDSLVGPDAASTDTACAEATPATHLRCKLVDQ
ncbi:Probable L-ectoine synthase [Mycobacteroides abscessus]|nr:Probable L-ectoine synthase [Mycobacteroides abscessus]